VNAETTSRDHTSERGVRPIVLGTRGSELALVQARVVADALRQTCGVLPETEIIRTGGDESHAPVDRSAGRKGLFTAELERALIEQQIDFAVHSAKDLPSAIHPETKIAATLSRGAVEDVLITKAPVSIEQLPKDGTVATGSIRRQRQLRWIRPDVEVVGLRGNVPTRLRKFATSHWDAIILARAGLDRLGFSWPEFQFAGEKFFGRILPVDQFLPAGGQGIIAVQTRANDSGMNETISLIDDSETHVCLRAEREFLRLLQGDCDLPIGVLAIAVDGEIELRAHFFGEAMTPKVVRSRGASPERVAADVFSKLNGS
jgi:porphobilinogen deaminase